ncbi:MAG: aspartyl-tRNA(Asn)/glutamyl-tRNA(Gln) amidotransferase subunit A [Paraglaciecola sp.]|jgi:aspartyl-tRNA(Asn)/glutamyl-tRNA(Gln) amidotransferase subunit A
MNVNIIPTDSFRKEVKKLLKKYRSLKKELIDLNQELELNPNLGTKISENTFKIRLGVKSKGRGKSGGMRVITYQLLENNDNLDVWLISIYDKSKITTRSQKYIDGVIAADVSQKKEKLSQSMSDKYTCLSQLQSDLKSNKTTLPQLLNHYLSKIESTKSLNIYIEVFADEARQKAQELQQKYEQNSGSVGKLFGAIISLKDNICYQGHGVTAGSKMLKGFESIYNATAVERLLAEDAIIVGRVNCDEFAMGSTTESSVYGVTRNAADTTRVPGGSSGGSAVAVQADTCLMSIGSDTGGSVRQPAAFCGVVGMKPTYGRISRYGLLAYGSSFDQIGTLTNCVEDAAILLEVMAGEDDFDATASSKDVGNYNEAIFSKKAKIAYFDTAMNHESMDGDVKKLSLDFVEKLKKDGHEVEAVDFEYLDYIIPAYYVLTTAEASSNLSRYDGIRFGHRSSEAKNIDEVYKKSRTEGFGTEVKRRIMLGTFVLSAGYYDAYYTKAQQVRALIAQRTEEILSEYDFILMPASPTPAWEIGKMDDDPVAMYLADIYTVQANMVGIPAIAFPIGEHSNGMPVGIQLMGRKFGEGEMLAFAKEVC